MTLFTSVVSIPYQLAQHSFPSLVLTHTHFSNKAKVEYSLNFKFLITSLYKKLYVYVKVLLQKM
jgi:hypothetical protein